MSLEEMRNALQLRPFRGFRLLVTDGAHYDIRHPDLCMVGPRIAIVGIPPAGQNEPIVERFAIVEMLHITRLDPLEVPPSATMN